MASSLSCVHVASPWSLEESRSTLVKFTQLDYITKVNNWLLSRISAWNLSIEVSCLLAKTKFVYIKCPGHMHL